MKYTLLATAIVYNPIIDRHLIIQRNDDNQHWENPGGKKELGESLNGTLKREVYEETGIVVDNYKLIYTSILFENRENLVGALAVGYIVITDTIDIKLTDEHIDYKWVGQEEYLEMVHDGIKKDIINYKIFDILDRIKELSPKY